MYAVFCVIDRKKLLFYEVLFSISILVMLAIFVPVLSRVYSRLSFFRRYDMQSISISTATADEKNSYIYPGSQLLFFLDKAMEKCLDVEVCMQLPNRGVLYHKVLERGQLVIGMNTAHRYGLHVGDTLYAKPSYTSEMQNYRITAIINDCYSPFVAFEQTGMVFAGYDSKFTDSLAIRYILFSTNPLRGLDNIIVQTSQSLIEVELLKISLYMFIVLFIGVYGVIFLLLYCLIKSILNIKISEQLLFLYRSGLSFIVLVCFFNCCFFVFPFFVAALLY